jgi:hypothetical protein
VVRAQDLLDVLGIERLGTLREPDKVGEDYGDDFALLARSVTR